MSSDYMLIFVTLRVVLCLKGQKLNKIRVSPTVSGHKVTCSTNLTIFRIDYVIVQI
jgi:hypothetical protein